MATKKKALKEINGCPVVMTIEMHIGKTPGRKLDVTAEEAIEMVTAMNYSIIELNAYDDFFPGEQDTFDTLTDKKMIRPCDDPNCVYNVLEKTIKDFTGNYEKLPWRKWAPDVIDGEKVVYHKDKIEVGCQTFTVEQLESMIKKCRSQK
jgi:hypothetical protein